MARECRVSRAPVVLPARRNVLNENISDQLSQGEQRGAYIRMGQGIRAKEQNSRPESESELAPL